MHLAVGTSGFQYPEWKGTFYPEKMPASGMLRFYAEHFATTEINYTFRQIPSAKTIANWAASTPAHFRFSPKAPQRITHFAKLRGCAEVLGVFHAAIAGLGPKLGSVLFQLPPTFKKDAPVLRDFLASLPPGIRAAFEFRHASWFDDEVSDLLRTHGAALCLAEDDELATPLVVTAGFGYLRLRRADYSRADLQRWAQFLRERKDDWRDVFIYFKHEETGTGPKYARQLMNLLHA